MMQSSALCWLVILGCLVLPQLAWSKPTDPEQLAAMADTLKYLQELDRYYSQVARPSWNSALYAATKYSCGEEVAYAYNLQANSRNVPGSPRSESGRMHELSKVERALKMLRLQELDRFYSQRTRPRFGKRSELRTLPEQETAPEESSERMWRRFVSRR